MGHASMKTTEMGKEHVNSYKTGLVYDPLYREHQPGAGHPESPERCNAVMRGIAESVPENVLVRLKPRAATEEEIALCHTHEYMKAVRRDVESGFRCLSTGDTDISERSLEAAFLAVGGVLTAVDAVVEGTVSNAFCVVRPPGHHATRDRGMGFCIFNNVAIAARHAQMKHGVDRILIADWDVHHGNGTQSIFYDDPSVFYFSTHQWPHYPGTGTVHEAGTGEGMGFTLNCPLPAGSGRHEILGAFTEKLVPAMGRFKPELVLISAGFDCRIHDPIGGFMLTDRDLSDLTGIVLDIADRHADGRLVSVLEGGYNLSGLASAAGAHVERMSR